MSHDNLSRRQLIRAAAIAGGAVAFGLPQVLLADSAQAYSVPSKMDWWYQARFGMFIHFGSYSYHGTGEWAFSAENWTKANYQTQVTAPFNPTSFNADTIAELAPGAGHQAIDLAGSQGRGRSTTTRHGGLNLCAHATGFLVQVLEPRPARALTSGSTRGRPDGPPCPGRGCAAGERPNSGTASTGRRSRRVG